MNYCGPNPIRLYREQAGLPQQDAALRAGMTRKYLDDLETGHERRWSVRLHPLAAVLGVAVEEIAIP